MAIHIDTEKSPIFFIQFQGSSTDEDLEKYLSWYQSVLEQATREKTPLGFIIDSGSSMGLTWKQRQRIIEIDKQGRTLFLASRSVMGVVLRNPIQRGVLTALAWYISFPPNFKVFESAAEAASWVQRTLAATTPISSPHAG
ncbi:MAG: hypothetical protein RMJ98_03840 [Myxococcales bacterium]|nr:hypothetical protein [Polyangiaceae bacterium]MDW8248421.1 hypothetical protein [Myxococcales bacterium]